jgi:hypothetical protein
MKSLTQAQNTRPTALKIEMTPTIPAACTAVNPTSCCAIGEAWLMIMIPAETLRNSITHSSQNCHVAIASPTVNSEVVAAFETAVFGSQPFGRQPCGGFTYHCAVNTTSTR